MPPTTRFYRYAQYPLLAGAWIALIGLPNFATAHDDDTDHHHEPTNPAETYRPTAVPDRIILTWTGDPSTTQAVTWRTEDNKRRGIAQIAVAEGGPAFTGKTTQLSATSETLKSNLSVARYHTVEFTGLQPRTKYLYRVGDGVNWSEWSQFRTASDRAEPFSFIYFGDAQNDVKSHWSRVVRGAYSDAPKARFMLHAGDLINRANSDGEWGEWFYAAGWLNRSIPSIATPGNHEYAKVGEGEAQTRVLSDHWKPTFAFPTNGPEKWTETVYYLDYQGVRIISLNSNKMEQAQADWLNQVLSDNPHRWSIVTMHHPIYSSKAGRDNPELRALLQPIFDQHRVDLVLQGHDHTYARSRLLAFENVSSGTTVHNKQAGTLYVVSVSGPKMYELGRREFMRRAAEGVQLYQIITVDGDELRYEARTAHGELYDAFSLRKRDGKVNELIDRIPDSEEYRQE